jgi:hypothetical protein
MLHKYYATEAIRNPYPQFPRIHDDILADTQTSEVRQILEPIKKNMMNVAARGNPLTTETNLLDL